MSSISNILATSLVSPLTLNLKKDFLSCLCEKIDILAKSRITLLACTTIKIFTFTTLSLWVTFLIASKCYNVWKDRFPPLRPILAQNPQVINQIEPVIGKTVMERAHEKVVSFILDPEATVLKFNFPIYILPRGIEQDLSFQTRLKVLEITDSSLDFFPNLNNFPVLEVLNLSCSRKLIGFAEGLGRADNLKQLLLGDCRRLISLPLDIGNCKQVEEIYLFRCENLIDLPDTLSRCRNLKILNLGNCRFPKLPELVFFLPPNCIVDYTGASIKVVTEIKERTTKRNYRGPIFQEREWGEAIRIKRARQSIRNF